jgi:signal transduction histidine kinase
LIIEDEVIGVLAVQSDDLTEADVSTITAFAHQVAAAWRKAQLFGLVQASRDRMRQLARQMVSAQEEERRNISQELHDELGQALTAIAFDLAAIEEELGPDLAPAIKSRLVDARSLAGQVDERVSEMALDLRPSMLDDLGLLPTLHWYTNRYAQRLDIEVEVEAINFDERLLPEMETALYRIVQEALTNVAKHAQASKVGIRLERTESALVAIVEDNGQGFEVGTMVGPSLPARGAGLLGIQERADLLGGTLSIESTPGQGTRLIIKVPI